MENHNGHRVLHQPTFSAVDLIEGRSQQNRPLKIVKVRHLRFGRVEPCHRPAPTWMTRSIGHGSSNPRRHR